MIGATGNSGQMAVQIGSVALRSANFQVLGSGQGSVSTAGYVAEFPTLIDAIAAGKLKVNSVPFALSKVEEVWNAPSDLGQRVVFVTI